MKWSRKHKRCIVCKKTKHKHVSKGYCKSCYFKKFLRKKMRNYMRDYWKNKPEQYNKQKQIMKEYIKSEKGKECHKKSVKKILEKDPKHYTKYRRNYKIKRMNQGRCAYGKCKKKISKKCRYFCREHRDYINRLARERRLKVKKNNETNQIQNL